jgi:hypothetical protein
VSLARSKLALRKFRDLLHQDDSKEALERPVVESLEWISGVVDDNGLCASWPGGQGYVSLTAWVVHFLVEAKDAGFLVDGALFDKLTRSLDQALRSDYSHFIDGEAYGERTWALSALAFAGKFNGSYAAELSRKSRYLDLEGVAQVLLAFHRAGETSSVVVEPLVRELWEALVIRLHQGREIYGGLQGRRSAVSGLILPSETRTVAEVTRALGRLQSDHPRFPVLVDALVTLGQDDGWGSTNANAEALLALSEILTPPFKRSTQGSIRIRIDNKSTDLSIGPERPVAHFASAEAGSGEVVLRSGDPVVVRAETTYVPAADGSRVPPRSMGFVVARELLLIVDDDRPPHRIDLKDPGKHVTFTAGDVVEEHVQVVNPKDRHYVAIVIPLAAGMEPLNPNLATAPPEASPLGKLTRAPTYRAFMDDHVAFYFDSLPTGTYDFYFRTRATVPGVFIQPAARAEMMYDGAVFGRSAGARVEIIRQDG